MVKNYTIPWKSALLAATKEGNAKKLQLLCVTKYLKVEFHYGEAENCNAKRTTLTGLGYSLHTADITLSPDSCCLGKHKNVSRTLISGSVFKCAT